MKKLLIIFFIIILTFLACDISFFYYTRSRQSNLIKSQEKYLKNKIYLPHYFLKLSKFEDTYKSRINNEKRPIMNPNSKEDSIVIFGCSFAYGYIFENNQTISYVLSKYSKRPIYNRARNCWGIQHMLYQLQNDKEMFKELKKPEYIIYVLIDGMNHFIRLYSTNFPSIMHNEYYLTYISNNGKLEKKKPPLNLYYNFAIIRHIQNKDIWKMIENNLYKNPNKEFFDFFSLHFLTINELIKQKWGNDTKFIILTFEETERQYWQPQLEEQGIKVIDIAETIGIKNLQNKEHGFFEPEIAGHPNGKLWELLVPKLKEIYPDL